MAKKVVKKKVTSKKEVVEKKNVMEVTAVSSDNTRITVLEERLNRIVAALSTAKPITKTM